MKTTCVLFALLLVLSAVTAEGQVQLKPESEIIFEDAYFPGLVSNESWLVYSHTLIAKTVVHNRQSGKEFYVMVGGDGSFPYLAPSVNFIQGNTLVGRALYFSEYAVGVFYLDNLLPEVTNQNGFQVHPVNWEIRSFLPDFGQNTALNAKRQLLAVSHNGGVNIYKIGEQNPVQEIYSDLKRMTSTQDGEWIAISDGRRVSLYRCSENLSGFELKGEYDAYENHANLPYGGRMTLSYSENNRIILAVSCASGIHRIFRMDTRIINPDTMATERRLLAGPGFSGPIFADGEFALCGDQIVHLLSGDVIGLLTTARGSLIGVLEMLGPKTMRIVIAENQDVGTVERVYLSTYTQQLLSVSHSVTPPGVSSQWGTVKIMGSPKIFKGGSCTFAVVAKRGKDIGLLRYFSINLWKKHKDAKNKQSTFLDVSNVQGDITVRAEFTKMTAKEKKNLKTVKFRDPVRLYGYSEDIPKEIYQLGNGEWRGYDEKGSGYTVFVTDSNVDIHKYWLYPGLVLTRNGELGAASLAATKNDGLRCRSSLLNNYANTFYR